MQCVPVTVPALLKTGTKYTDIKIIKKKKIVAYQ
jgi:hypothetical protein